MLQDRFATGDAHGMNMIARAADHLRQWIPDRWQVERNLLFGGLESEKKASASLLSGGKGKRVVAGVRLPRELMRTHLGGRRGHCLLGPARSISRLIRAVEDVDFRPDRKQ